MTLDNPTGCRFSEEGEAAFDGMMRFADETTGRIVVGEAFQLAGARMVPSLTSSAIEEYSGGMDHVAWAAMPEGTTWNGLALRRMGVETVILPEIDGLEQRMINFSDPPDQVRAVLRRLGADIPRSEPLTLDDANSYAEASCGGTMRVEPAEDGGAMLICDRGC